MAKRATKPEPEPESELILEESPEPRLAQVTERTYKTRTYLEEEQPQLETATDPEPDPHDPLVFLQNVDRTGGKVSMTVHVLPNYDRDGNSSTYAPGRTWVARFDWSPDLVECYRERVQERWPAGGTFDFEMKESGRPMKGGRWREKLAPFNTTPGQVTTAPAAPGYPVIVNPAPGPPAPEPPTFRERIGDIKELVTVADMLRPPAPPASNGQTGADKPIGERILEAVALKALESDKGPGFEKILEIFHGNREPGTVETIFNSPVLQEVVRAVAPGLNSMMQTYAYKQQLEAIKLRRELEAASGVVGAEAKPGDLPPPPPPDGAVLASAPAAAMSEEQIRAAKMNQRWQRSITRLVEDCDDLADPLAAVQNILDLEGDYNEELSPTIHWLLGLPTEQLFDACAQILPNPNAKQHVLTLKQDADRVKWLSGVQDQVKQLLSQNQGDVEDAGKESNDTEGNRA